MKDTVKFDMADSVKRLYEMDVKPHKCCVTTQLPADVAEAMAYIPFQLDKTAYTPEIALDEGSFFTALNKPFCGRSLLNE